MAKQIIIINPNKLISELSQSTKKPCLITFSVQQAKFWKKNKPKKNVLGTFWKRLTKNMFKYRGSPSVYFGVQGAFGKNFGSVSQKWISQNRTKRRPPLFCRWGYFGCFDVSCDGIYFGSVLRTIFQHTSHLDSKNIAGLFGNLHHCRLAHC